MVSSVVNKYLSFAMLVVFSVAGCTIGSPGAEVAQKVVEDMYQAQKDQDLDKALTFYSKKRSQEEWRMHLDHIVEALGTVETFTLKKTEVNTVLSGRFYIFEYQVAYSSGKQAKETLTLFDTVETGDTTEIVSHVVSAEGFTQRI